MEKLAQKEFRHRIIAVVDRQELEFLDKVGRDALYSTGHKLSYNEIVRGLIDFMLEIGLSGDNIKSRNALRDKLKQKAVLPVGQADPKTDSQPRPGLKKA